MSKPIRRAGVIGAGVMGSGIAAHFANAGVEVVLLDIVPPSLTEAEKKDPVARNRFAAGGLDKMLKSRPAALFHKSMARLVTVGNVEDDLGKLANCDLVIEAIIEQIDHKRALFEKLEATLSADCIVASNTSGLRIVDMLSGRGEGFKKRFLVMHFFNPVRYMKLLELVVGPDTDAETTERIRHFGQEVLGKGLVWGKDTPNFVGNRIGVHAMLATIHQMVEDGLAPEDVDAITGQPMGHPKSASFRTADMVGLDTFAHVAKNCYEALVDDEEREVFKAPAFVSAMLEKKLLGDKTRAGFYRKGASREIDTFDYKTLDYRPKGGDPKIKDAMKAISKIEDPKERVRKLAADTGPAGAFAWKITSRSLAYAARRIGEITDDVESIDNAMKWGYNWELGPFEVWDALGFAATYDKMVEAGIKLPDWVKAMRDSGATGFYQDGEPKEKVAPSGSIPPHATLETALAHPVVSKAIDLLRPVYERTIKEAAHIPFLASLAEKAQADKAKGPMLFDPKSGQYVPRKKDKRELSVAEMRHGSAPVLKNDGAEAWDFGDGVLGLTFKTKANSIDPDVIKMLGDVVDRAERDFRAVVIANEGDFFCVGANVFMVVMAASQKAWDQIEVMVKGYQDAVQRLRYARVPVVAAPYNMTLGGGLELCFGCDAVQAAAETYSGLVEVGVGLIPGGAGTMNMLWRALENIPEGIDSKVVTQEMVVQTFKNIALAKVATSAHEAKELGYFRKTDGVSFDRARQLHEAKARAVALAEAGYHPAVPKAYTLPGDGGIATLSMMVETLEAGGYASAHDALIARKLAVVLSGGRGGGAREVTEQDVLDLEREAFVSLCGEEKSQQRMQYMLMNNKPLRN